MIKWSKCWVVSHGHPPGSMAWFFPFLNVQRMDAFFRSCAPPPPPIRQNVGRKILPRIGQRTNRVLGWNKKREPLEEKCSVSSEDRKVPV